MHDTPALPAKSLSLCEAGTAIAFAALAFLSLMIAAMAHTSE